MAEHAENLVRRLGDEKPSTDREIVRLLIEVLWDAYSDPRIVAGYDVRVQCRTDPDLRAALVGMLRSSDIAGSELVTLLVPEFFQVSSAALGAMSLVVVSALQGRAFARASMPDPTADQALVDELAELVVGRLRSLSLTSDHPERWS